MSGQYVETNTRSFLVGAAALAPYLRVKSGAAGIEAAGATDRGIGYTLLRCEAESHGAVRLYSANGTIPMTAAVAITAGDEVFSAASGKVSNVQAAGSYRLGIALETVSGNGAILEVAQCEPEKPEAWGQYTMVAGDDTSGTKDIDTGLDNISSFQVEVVTAAGVVTGADMVKSATGGSITIADGTSYKLTANHIARWWAGG